MINLYKFLFNCGIAASFLVSYACLFDLSTTLSIEGPNPFAASLCIAIAAILPTWFLGYANSGNYDKAKEFVDVRDEDVTQDFLRFYSMTTICVTLVSSMLATYSGSALGREIPMVFLMQALFVVLKRYLHLDFVSYSDALIAGTASGFGGLFGAPHMGILYALELYGWKKMKLMPKVAWATMLFVPAFVFVQQYLFNRTDVLLFGFIHNKEAEQFSIAHLDVILILAFLSSIVAVLFVTLLKIRIFIKNKFDRRVHLYLMPLFGVAIIYFLSSNRLHYMMHDGKNIIISLSVHNEALTSIYDFFIRIVNVLLVFVSGATGGLFFPGLALGAKCGHEVFNLEYFQLVPHYICIVTVMSCFLSLILKVRYTIVILMLWISGSIYVTIPVVTSVLVVHFVNKFLTEKIINKLC